MYWTNTQDIFSHDNNKNMKNENLIQEVYSELVDLGWPDVEVSKIDNYSSTRKFDYFDLYPNKRIITINPNPKTSSWVFDFSNDKLKELKEEMIKLFSKNINEK